MLSYFLYELYIDKDYPQVRTNKYKAEYRLKQQNSDTSYTSSKRKKEQMRKQERRYLFPHLFSSLLKGK